MAYKIVLPQKMVLQGLVWEALFFFMILRIEFFHAVWTDAV
jgi:hypothetical protein